MPNSRQVAKLVWRSHPKELPLPIPKPGGDNRVALWVSEIGSIFLVPERRDRPSHEKPQEPGGTQ